MCGLSQVMELAHQKQHTIKVSLLPVQSGVSSCCGCVDLYAKFAVPWHFQVNASVPMCMRSTYRTVLMSFDRRCFGVACTHLPLLMPSSFSLIDHCVSHTGRQAIRLHRALSHQAVKIRELLGLHMHMVIQASNGRLGLAASCKILSCLPWGSSPCITLSLSCLHSCCGICIHPGRL